MSGYQIYTKMTFGAYHMALLNWHHFRWTRREILRCICFCMRGYQMYNAVALKWREAFTVVHFRTSELLTRSNSMENLKLKIIKNLYENQLPELLKLIECKTQI